MSYETADSQKEEFRKYLEMLEFVGRSSFPKGPKYRHSRMWGFHVGNYSYDFLGSIPHNST